MSFFTKRGVEVVLYKGRERRSGPQYGQVDVHLPGFEDFLGGTDTEDSDSDDEDAFDRRSSRYAAAAPYGGVYGRSVEGQMAEVYEARRVQSEKHRLEKKRAKQQKKEKKRRKALKEAERKYALYLTCVSPRDFAASQPYGSAYDSREFEERRR
ncbi:hypothetical protein K474DRAFT_157751 [Panus rudis PR-1116 ss-1]|nr:hypothetical protein K474DRAFT_157751 [Panus rudis PR-1116 ss-1]